jgi:hypothetical protein
MTRGPFATFADELEARAAISDAMNRYCRGVDRCDWELLRSAYHPGAIDDHGDFYGTVEEFIADAQERHRAVEQSMHFIGNMLFSFPTVDVAIVESYCVAFLRYVPPAPAVAAGSAAARLRAVVRYVDRFERREGEWRIAHRTVVFEDRTFEQLSEPFVLDGMRNTQRHGTDDPLYSLLASAS